MVAAAIPDPEAVAGSETCDSHTARISQTESIAMHQPVRPCSARHRQRMIDLLVSWLLVGSGLLLARLLPPYSVLLGWSPAFWLVLAPLTMLLALDPGWEVGS